MNPGVLPDEECSKIWHTQLAVKPSIQGMMIKFDGVSNFVLDRIFEKGFDFRLFATDPTILPKDEARFIIFDVPSNKPNSKSSKICLIAWIPSTVPSKDKFTYAASTGTIKATWDLNRDFNFDDISGFDYDSLCKELRLN